MKNEGYVNMKLEMFKKSRKQKDLEKLLNKSRYQICTKINKLRGAKFTQEELEKIAEFLNVDVEDIKH